MVGLSIVLESQQATTITSAAKADSALVINKIISIINKPAPPSSPPSTPFKSSLRRCSFLDRCFLCYTALLHNKDIYMYQGDKAFCSVECRFQQILMDEEDELKAMNKTTIPQTNNGRDKCCLAAMRRPATPSPWPRKSRYN
ncbi:hypothetical protein DCAR_0935439 [Daucus carota subsp. sativus]|uniref:Uncharacterized protein n=1 Tax=Daucus carota subsp. sativus TaxID=79200 RepID=A0A175YIG6_DAUCS|nr:PREDICTED: uncharacterized protein LOC108202266 [Daucus carota subsp. sativus]WOH15892.1 hypothetical protein DCAR_0935439 [Daucus carota subsp. sativus]